MTSLLYHPSDHDSGWSKCCKAFYTVTIVEFGAPDGIG
jgi:hypothetical protein